MPTDEVKLMGDELIAFDEETLVAFISHKFDIDYYEDPTETRLLDFSYIEDFPPQLIAYLEDNADKFVLPNIYVPVDDRFMSIYHGDHNDYDTLFKYEIPQIDCKDLCDVIMPMYQKALANPNTTYTANWIQKNHFKLYNCTHSKVDNIILNKYDITHALDFLGSRLSESVERVAKIIKFTASKPTLFITNDGDYLAFRDELKNISKGMLTIADVEEIKLGTDKLINKYKIKQPVEHVYHEPTDDDLRDEISGLLERISNDNLTAAENQYIKELKSPNRGKQILSEVVSK